MACHVTDSADIGSKGVTGLGNNNVSGIGSSSKTQSISEKSKPGKQVPMLHGNLLDHKIPFLLFLFFVFRFFNFPNFLYKGNPPNEVQT